MNSVSRSIFRRRKNRDFLGKSSMGLLIFCYLFLHLVEPSSAAAHESLDQRATKVPASKVPETKVTEAKELCTGFAPKNKLRIPVGHKTGGRFSQLSGISLAEFNEVIDRIEAIYAPEFEAAGGRLIVNRRWDSGQVNAQASQSNNEWNVTMFGGLARHHFTTKDSFALVMCHEVGHHIGGAPKKDHAVNKWATNEGGSDYFASLKCLRRYFAGEDNVAAVSLLDVHPIVKARCKSEHHSAEKQSICIRSAVAGLQAARLLGELADPKNDLSWEKPDTSTVKKTFDGHPAAQCRLDTYFAGAVCRVDPSVPVSQTDYREGSCVAANDQFGFRPACWFVDPVVILMAQQ